MEDLLVLLNLFEPLLATVTDGDDDELLSSMAAMKVFIEYSYGYGQCAARLRLGLI